MNITFSSTDFIPNKMRIVRYRYDDGSEQFSIEVVRDDGATDEVSFFTETRTAAEVVAFKLANPAIEREGDFAVDFEDDE